ncbi:MAG TPA: LLM class flavin-dependent oxidoreductase [Thermomicrobiales bacterium]|nr:LLM class flavin-dependent oxidoreductase [Thermomicrobiales bacterium]
MATRYRGLMLEGRPNVMSLNAGLVIPRGGARSVVERIVMAENRGVPAIWSTAGGVSADTVSAFAVAASRTERIVLGTSIVPTYPRHPFVMASEALAIEDVAPGRLRLGIGPSHRPTIEGSFGIPMGKPLNHLREYVGILRALLWEGNVDFSGEYYTVHAALPEGIEPPKTPLPISALRPNAWRLAGEISDGAISWLNPIDYVVDVAMPALQEGAQAADRPRPPAIVHVPVAISTDRAAARAAFRERFPVYGRLPFYAGMFEMAGYPVEQDGRMPDGLIDDLLVSGTADQVRDRLEAVRRRGIDELLVSHVPVGDEAPELEALSALLAAG